MSKNTNIEWTDHTFNPWVGCTKISPACDNCYAEVWAKRGGKAANVKWGAGEERRRTSHHNWNQPLKWDAEAKRLGIRYKVFCASLADVFDNAIDPQWRSDLFDLIANTTNLDWLLLTKRIGNAGNMLPVPFDFDKHYPNVWIGATICNQEEANRDIPKLLAIDAAKRFLSMEPLLGPVDLTQIPISGHGHHELSPIVTANVLKRRKECPALPELHLVIVGGESGPHSRPLHPEWVRSLRDQCDDAGVEFMFKQWGEWKPINQMKESEHAALYASKVKAKPHEDQANLDDVYGRKCTVPTTVAHIDGSTHEIAAPMAFLQGTEPMQIFKVGKKSAGRDLDGRTWDGSLSGAAP